MYKNLKLRQVICLWTFVALLGNFIVLPSSYAQELYLPAPGTMVRLSQTFNPPILKGIKIHPDNPFRFDFILDKGDDPSVIASPERAKQSQTELKAEANKLIKYFLASITIPEKDLWVNLSPYEKDRIIPKSFGLTAMGRDLLAEDYMLKQITASLIYPEEEVGKKFWKRVYAEAVKKYGTTNIPVNTFNKVWIVPEKAVVYENKNCAYVIESRLKVLLEEDYLSLEKHGVVGVSSKSVQEMVGYGPAPTDNYLHSFASKIVREVVIPELTIEINEGKNFAQLRQIYNSLILAIWLKDKIKDSVLGQAYVDKEKISGVDIDDKDVKDKVWARYVQAFKKGAYNYIKEDYDPTLKQIIPRKYFSGGAGLFETRNVFLRSHDRVQLRQGILNHAMVVEADVQAMNEGPNMNPIYREIKEALKAAFAPGKSYAEQVAGLDGRKRFVKTADGYKPLPVEGVAISYPTADPREDRNFYVRLRNLGEKFKNSLSDSLREKIAFLDNDAYHVSIVAIAKITDKNRHLCDKLQKRVDAFFKKMPEDFRRKISAKIVGIDMFVAPRILKFRLEMDKQFMDSFTRAFHDDLSKDPELLEFYNRLPYEPGKFIYHITLGFLMEPLTSDEIDNLVASMEESSKEENHIEYNQPVGRLTWFKDMKPILDQSPVEVKEVLSKEDVIQYARNDHPLSRHTFKTQVASDIEEMLSQPDTLSEFSKMSKFMSKTALNIEARLYLMTSFLYYLKRAQNLKRIFFGVSEVEEWLKNERNVNLVNELVSIKHLEKECPIPFRILRTMRYFQDLNVFKQEEYIRFVKRIRRLPIDSDAVLFSGRFLSLYADVPDKDVQRFLNNAVLMANDYFYYQYPQYSDEYIPSDLKDVLKTIKRLKDVLPGLKAQFLSSEPAKGLMDSFKDSLREAQEKKQELEVLPGRKFSIEELFGFINSDNFSLFDTFSYIGFPASRYPFIRPYNGVPLTMLHGTDRYERIINEGHLISQVENRTYTDNARNSKYIFFGTPYNHFSRNPGNFIMGHEWNFGKSVFEFPFSILHQDSKSLFIPRGKILAHFLSNERKDLEGESIPEDIVEKGEYAVSLTEAIRIYYYSDEEKQKIEKALKAKGLGIPLRFLKEAQEIYDQMHKQSLAILDQYIDSHSDLIETLAKLKEELEQNLVEQVQKLLNVTEVSPLLKSYIHEYSVITFSELDAQTGILNSDVDINRAMVINSLRKPYKVLDQDILVVDDEISFDKINVNGQFVTMNSQEVDVEVSVEQEMVNRDLEDDPVAKRKEGAGRSVEEFVNDPVTSRREDILMTFNGITGNYYEANSAVLKDGKFIVKGNGAKGVGQKVYEKLKGRFWFLPVDFLLPSEDPIKEAWVEDGELRTNLGHKNGIFGAVIIRNGKSTLPESISQEDNGNEYIYFKTKGSRFLGHEVNAPRGKRAAMSAMGYTKDGKLFRATLIGDPNDSKRGEPNIDEFVEYLLYKGVTNAILTGTVADVNTYIKGTDTPFTSARERMGVVSKETLLKAGLSLDQVNKLFVFLKANKILEIDPKDEAKGTLNKFSNELKPLLLSEFGADSRTILDAIQTTCKESYLGNIFFPGKRPNATHVVVYKKVVNLKDLDTRPQMNRTNYFLSVFADPRLLDAIYKAVPIVRSFVLRKQMETGQMPTVNEIKRLVQGADKEVLKAINDRKIEYYYLPDLLLLSGIELDPGSKEALKFFISIMNEAGEDLDKQIKKLKSQPNILMQVIVLKWLANTAELKGVQYQKQRERAQDFLKRFVDMFFIEFEGKKILDSFSDMVNRTIAKIRTEKELSNDQILIVPVLTSGEQLGQYVQRNIKDRDVVVKPLLFTTAMSVEFGREGAEFQKNSLFTAQGKARALKYLQQQRIVNEQIKHIIFLDTGQTGQFGRLLNSMLEEQKIGSDLLLLDHDDYQKRGIEKKWAHGLNDEEAWQDRGKDLNWTEVMMDNVLEHSIEVPYYKVNYDEHGNAHVDTTPTPRQWMANLVSQKIKEYASPLPDASASPAMNSISLKRGGIDLTRNKNLLQVRKQGSGLQFNYNPAMIQQLKNASGLRPIIVGIYPMTITIFEFFALSDKEI